MKPLHTDSITLRTRRDTRRLAEKLGSKVRAGDFIMLEGPLGAGKTFFVRGFMRALGLPEKTPVTSPTFILVQEFETNPPVVHTDLYRIESGSDIRELGLSDRIGHDAVVITEWGEQFIETLGVPDLLLRLDRVGAPSTSASTATERLVTLEAYSERGRELLTRVLPGPASQDT